MESIVIAKGTTYVLPEGIRSAKIELYGDIIELPAVLYEFWRQFQEPCKLGGARNSFEEEGLPVELFDQSIELLQKEGLLEVTTG